MCIHAHKVLRSLFRIPGEKRENIEWNEFAQVSVARLASPNSLLSVLTTLRRRTRYRNFRVGGFEGLVGRENRMGGCILNAPSRIYY